MINQMFDQFFRYLSTYQLLSGLKASRLAIQHQSAESVVSKNLQSTISKNQQSPFCPKYLLRFEIDKLKQYRYLTRSNPVSILSHLGSSIKDHFSVTSLQPAACSDNSCLTPTPDHFTMLPKCSPINTQNRFSHTLLMMSVFQYQ